jgi:hypothetical protein
MFARGNFLVIQVYKFSLFFRAQVSNGSPSRPCTNMTSTAGSFDLETAISSVKASLGNSPTDAPGSYNLSLQVWVSLIIIRMPFVLRHFKSRAPTPNAGETGLLNIRPPSQMLDECFSTCMQWQIEKGPIADRPSLDSRLREQQTSWIA